MSTDFDVIVVGSGITGGWAAKELGERGLKVLLLERGRDVKHGDYPTEHAGPWTMPYRGMGDQERYKRDYPIQSTHFLFNEYCEHFFVNDREAPYQCDPARPFFWYRGNQVGGRSLIWGRHTYRWSDLDFEANKRDGHGVDWPIRYQDLQPWYDHVEDFIGVSGQAEGLAHLPDGKFLPPMQFNCAEKLFKTRVEEKFHDRIVTIGRVAVLTQPHRGRGACHYCGPCERGCSVGAYFSTQSSTLPAAMATGNVTLLANHLVEKIVCDPLTGRATGVNAIATDTRARHFVSARMVFLCASAFASTQILLNSASEKHPGGIGHASGALGHYLMDHTMSLSARALMPGMQDRYYQGNRPNTMYIPRFRNVSAPQEDFVRGYGYQGLAWRGSWRRGIGDSGFGKEALHKPGPWLIVLAALGETLPRHENYLELDAKHPDPFGIPQIKIHYSPGDNEARMMRDAKEQAVAMLAAAGAQVQAATSDLLPSGSGIHEMGTARMGNDPASAVLNKHNQCHAAPNVFVTDGACMASGACQNPSLTYMAITARACDFAATELRAGRL